MKNRYRIVKRGNVVSQEKALIGVFCTFLRAFDVCILVPLHPNFIKSYGGKLITRLYL